MNIFFLPTRSDLSIINKIFFSHRSYFADEMNDSFMATSRVKVNSTAVLSVSTTPVPHDGAKSFRIYLRNRLMIKRYYPIEPNDLHIYDDTFFYGLTSERNVPVHMVYVNVSQNLSTNGRCHGSYRID